MSKPTNTSMNYSAENYYRHTEANAERRMKGRHYVREEGYKAPWLLRLANCYGMRREFSIRDMRDVREWWGMGEHPLELFPRPVRKGRQGC